MGANFTAKLSLPKVPEFLSVHAFPISRSGLPTYKSFSYIFKSNCYFVSVIDSQLSHFQFYQFLTKFIYGLVVVVNWDSSIGTVFWKSQKKSFWRENWNETLLVIFSTLSFRRIFRLPSLNGCTLVMFFLVIYEVLIM